MGMRCFGGFVTVEVRCELLVLLEACVTLRLSVFCCVFNDVLPLVASLSGVGL
jgi:hypothetical protein